MQDYVIPTVEEITGPDRTKISLRKVPQVGKAIMELGECHDQIIDYFLTLSSRQHVSVYRLVCIIDSLFKACSRNPHKRDIRDKFGPLSMKLVCKARGYLDPTNIKKVNDMVILWEKNGWIPVDSDRLTPHPVQPVQPGDISGISQPRIPDVHSRPGARAVDGKNDVRTPRTVATKPARGQGSVDMPAIPAKERQRSRTPTRPKSPGDMPQRTQSPASKQKQADPSKRQVNEESAARSGLRTPVARPEPDAAGQRSRTPVASKQNLSESHPRTPLATQQKQPDAGNKRQRSRTPAAATRGVPANVIQHLHSPATKQKQSEPAVIKRPQTPAAGGVASKENRRSRTPVATGRNSLAGAKACDARNKAAVSEQQRDEVVVKRPKTAGFAEPKQQGAPAQARQRSRTPVAPANGASAQPARSRTPLATARPKQPAPSRPPSAKTSAADPARRGRNFAGGSPADATVFAPGNLGAIRTSTAVARQPQPVAQRNPRQRSRTPASVNRTLSAISPFDAPRTTPPAAAVAQRQRSRTPVAVSNIRQPPAVGNTRNLPVTTARRNATVSVARPGRCPPTAPNSNSAIRQRLRPQSDSGGASSHSSEGESGVDDGGNSDSSSSSSASFASRDGWHSDSTRQFAMLPKTKPPPPVAPKKAPPPPPAAYMRGVRPPPPPPSGPPRIAAKCARKAPAPPRRPRSRSVSVRHSNIRNVSGARPPGRRDRMLQCEQSSNGALQRTHAPTRHERSAQRTRDAPHIHHHREGNRPENGGHTSYDRTERPVPYTERPVTRAKVDPAPRSRIRSQHNERRYANDRQREDSRGRRSRR